ncbi:MAG: AMP-dependent synthetase [Sphingomonadales bacterium BRH_c3]|nr:MAG: AMP-dependent synthetase [Sphingomonadales bacterium BRH_c3]
MNLFALLDNAMRRHGDRPALCLGTEVLATYRCLHADALSLAAGLRKMAPVGSRVAIISRNCPEYLAIIFGVWASGLIAVPINAKLHPLEIADVVQDSGAAIVFVGPEFAPQTAAILRSRSVASLITIGDASYERLLEVAPDGVVEVAADDLAWLFYTSGTTGRSKGAMLSHRNLLAMTIAHLADFENISAEDSIIHAAPMSHGSGLYMLPYVARGGRHVVPISAGFDPPEFLHLANHHQRSAAFLVPTMLRRLRIEVDRGKHTTDGIRHIIYGGGPMYVDELRQALGTFGRCLTQLYGQGEAPMTITGLRSDEHAEETNQNTVGWPRSGVEVAVFDVNERKVPPDAVGEIVCRGDVVMAGYWGNPRATAETLRGGWLHTGDIGSLDHCGRLTLHDRSKDVIISGGSNIYPREVEEALLGHTAVAEVSVVGQPDAEWGEVVVAFIVRDGDKHVDEAMLHEHCLKRIARFKRPKRYVFLDELPKSNYGKVMKRELRAYLGSNIFESGQ